MSQYWHVAKIVKVSKYGNIILERLKILSLNEVTPNGQGLLQGWNSLLVRPEPLLNKGIKVQVNKQKPNNVRPAQMKHNSDKMTIAPMSSQPCSKPHPMFAFQQNPMFAFQQN